MTDAGLFQLLEKSQSFACEYGEYLSSHLPMALIALQRIGADEKQIMNFYSAYIQILEKQKSDEIRIDERNWRNFIGEHKYNSAYREYFLAKVENIGIEGTLSETLPILIPGLSGGAFHPLIRLGYAVEIENNWEIAEALASWCMAYQELGKIKDNTKNSPAKILESLKTLSSIAKENPIEIRGDNVFSYLKSVATTDTFKNFFDSLNLLDISLDQVADATIKPYLSTKDSFTALHCVTATYAMRTLAPYVEGKDGLKYLWQSVCATYVITKLVPIINHVDTTQIPSWQEIFEIARDHKNDHVIKLAYTAHSEFLRSKNCLYQLAAARKSGLVSWL